MGGMRGSHAGMVHTMSQRVFRITLLASVVMSGPVAAQHTTDLWIGQSGGRLALHPGGLIPDRVYLPLDPVDTFLRGWSGNDPGFDAAPGIAGGVAPLGAGAGVYLRVVVLDPGLFVIGNSFEVLEFPGDETRLGGNTLHVHLTWFIDRDDPWFDPEQCVWEGTFRLLDFGTTFYQQSQPFTLLFSNVQVRGGGFPPTPMQATGDFDDNGNIDLDDYAALAVCVGTPGERPAPNDPDITTCEVECYNAFDFDDDFDVDLKDFAAFARRMGP
jgi:hypothetical protein